MTCPICDQKPMNCDCSETERRQYSQVCDMEELVDHLYKKIDGLRLAPDEREAINAMACYFDTKGNITMQAWGSLLRVILLRNDRLGHQDGQ